MPDSTASPPDLHAASPSGSRHASPTGLHPLRVVLDSNVWIDILVFDDPHTRPIRAALESGALIALIDARCLAELTRVLDYPQFVQRAIDKTAALATVARLTHFVEPAANAQPSPDNPSPLPKCKDRDDQKFLELAWVSGAQWLVSKDRAVLKLARRIARDFGYQIAQPAPFVALSGLATVASASSTCGAGAAPTPEPA